MIYRDGFGYLRQVPDGQFADGLGDYSDAGEVVYDGFGNPLGIAPFLAALAPLAAKLIPAAASFLPGLVSSVMGPRPSAPPPQATAPLPLPAAPPSAPAPPPVITAPATPTIIQVPVPVPMPLQQPLGPSPYLQPRRPLIVYRRRRRVRRVPVRLRVTERVTAPPTEVPAQPPPVAVLPPPQVPPPSAPPVATESSGGVSGYGWYAPFSGYF
jgi:hypothetical protein